MPDDRTTRAIIRDEALRLFAANGPNAVTLRQVAAGAGVSPGLVVHHFGSKEGLRDAVDQHVLTAFDAALRTLTDAHNSSDPVATESLAEMLMRHLPAGSPMPSYLCRLLVADGETGKALFRRLFEVSKASLDAMVAAGIAEPGRDAAVRAAFLLTNDLAVLLLRNHLTDALGVDPLSAEGMAGWTSEALAIYSTGLRAANGGGQK
jgi:AcrR family transcriptional regulator